MEVLIHGIFTLIKLAILGSVYAILIFATFRLIGFLRPDSWFDKTSKNKKKFWFSCGSVISAGLLLFSMTHWGSHGLGDSSRIPLNHGKSVIGINGTQAYLKEVKYKNGNLWIEKFAIVENFLVGKTAVSPVDDPMDYFAWNLKTNEINYFNTETEYLEYVKDYDLPSITDFKPIGDHYSDYWHGWRFWTLL